MNPFSQFYDYLERIMRTGVKKMDRTGTGTLSVFGHMMRFNLRDGFPLFAGKSTSFRLIATELLWFLRGTHTEPGDHNFLLENDCHIWDEWVKPDGSFGPTYGFQWRHHPDGKGGSIDQVRNIIERLPGNPDCRRKIVSAWNVADVESGEMALAPCHLLFQFYTSPMTFEDRLACWIRRHDPTADAVSKMAGNEAWAQDWMDDCNVPTRYIDCMLYQRSCDSFLGVPFNIASYALLLSMIGQLVNMEPREFVWSGADCHIYLNHLKQVEELLGRRDEDTRPLPKLWLNPAIKDIDDFTLDDMKVTGYQSLGKIAAPISV